MPDDPPSVRPLDSFEKGPHHAPPRLVVAVGLLVAGALIGWTIASLGGDSIATASSTTRPPEEASSLGLASSDSGPTVSWQAATSVPVTTGLQYAGSTDPVDYGGSVYVVVRFSDSGDIIRNQLWSTEDGLEWSGVEINLGAPVTVVELTAIDNGLLITALDDDGIGVWRSIPGRALGGESWNRVPIEVPPGFQAAFHRTAVNQRGEIVTTIVGSLDLWREVIAPYVPEDVDLSDPELIFFEGSLFVSGDETPLQLFSELPEVLTTRDTVWIRLVPADGQEVLLTRELPAGAYPIEPAPDLAFVSVALSWRSEDGIGFVPVTGRGALPSGYFLPEPWGDGFIAATYELVDSFAPDEDVRLWHSAAGRAWQLYDFQPPQECSPYYFATSRDRMLLTSESGERCLFSGDEWTILDEPSEVAYVVGGPAGFIGYPRSFDYETAAYSSDGRSWVDVEIPGATPYPTLAILESRLFALSVDRRRPNQAAQIELWLGAVE